MSITITTLNNDAAVAKTFTAVGGGTSKWYNSTDATATFSQELLVKQQLVQAKGQPQKRRALVQSKARMVDSLSGLEEEIVMNFTVLTPVLLQNLSTTQRKDCLAYLRNLVTATIEEQLCNGELGP